MGFAKDERQKTSNGEDEEKERADHEWWDKLTVVVVDGSPLALALVVAVAVAVAVREDVGMLRVQMYCIGGRWKNGRINRCPEEPVRCYAAL